MTKTIFKKRIISPIPMGLLFILIQFVFSGCGVKGDPLPPVAPPDIGRGQPSFKKATEDLAFPSLPPIEGVEQEGDESSKKRENDE